MAIATLSIDLVAKLANLERDMGKAAHIAEKNAARMESAFSGVKTSLAAIGSVLTVGAFAGMVRGVADAGDQLAKLSTKTGAAVEELSKLQYAASLSDLSNEDLGASLIKLNKVMGEAAEGSKQATEALARFGIAPDSSMTAIDAFKQIADRVKATGNEAKIASGLNDVFGKSFASLIPLLKGGSEGLKETGDELERMGGVMSGDLAKASEQFNDNLTKIETSLNALKISTLGPVVEGLESLTSKFNEAAKAAGGFWAGLATWGTTGGDQEKNPSASIVEISKKLAKLKADRDALAKPTFTNKINDFVFGDVGDLDRQIGYLTKQLGYLQNLNTASVGNVKDSWLASSGGEGIAGTPKKPARTGSSKVEKFDLSQFDALIKAEEYYLKALNGIAAAQESARRSTLGLSEAQSKLLDLQQSDVWATLSAEQRQAAEEQARYADETIRAAESQERLNSLIAGLDSSQIEQAWKDMDLLNQALEAGSVSQAQYSEAVKKLFDSGNEKIKEQKSMAEELGMTFSSAFEDAIVKGEEFSEVLEGIGEDILRILVRMNITEPLAGAVGSFDFSSLFANANGGVYSSPSLSAYSGGVYSSPQLFKFASGAGVFGEAGPEAIMPLKRGPDGKLGVSGAGSNVIVNLVESPGSGKGGSTSTTTGSNGEQIITVLVEKIKGDLIKDVGSGGSFASAMEGQYSLNRSAGAWR